jgi:ABC-type transport system involved in cytochrome bd biosynthesis fused ATPase/permease subunit
LLDVSDQGSPRRNRIYKNQPQALIHKVQTAIYFELSGDRMTDIAHTVSTSAQTAPLVEVNGIEVIYNHVILVLKGVSLQVPHQSIVALLGGNGAGKTTTLRAISNLLKGERGEVTKGGITLEGEQIANLSPADLVKRGVVQVMEGRHCFAHLTIEENLLTGSYTRTDKGEIAPISRRSTTTSRASRPGAPARRPTPRAASSRCAPSAAR